MSATCSTETGFSRKRDLRRRRGALPPPPRPGRGRSAGAARRARPLRRCRARGPAGARAARVRPARPRPSRTSSRKSRLPMAAPMTVRPAGLAPRRACSGSSGIDFRDLEIVRGRAQETRPGSRGIRDAVHQPVRGQNLQAGRMHVDERHHDAVRARQAGVLVAEGQRGFVAVMAVGDQQLLVAPSAPGWRAASAIFQTRWTAPYSSVDLGQGRGSRRLDRAARRPRRPGRDTA